MAKRQADPDVHNYSEQILDFWPTIAQAWNAHSDERPVIELDINDNVIKVHPAQGYFERLAEGERQPIQAQFEKLLAQGGIMVFIRDRAQRILQMFPITTSDMVDLTRLFQARISLQ